MCRFRVPPNDYLVSRLASRSGDVTAAASGSIGPGGPRCGEGPSSLRSPPPGVVFEAYDMPEVKTENGVDGEPNGFNVSWFKDPDGKILSIEPHRDA